MTFMAADIRTTTGSNFKVKHDGQNSWRIPCSSLWSSQYVMQLQLWNLIAGFDMDLVAEHIKLSQVLNVVSEEGCTIHR